MNYSKILTSSWNMKPTMSVATTLLHVPTGLIAQSLLLTELVENVPLLLLSKKVIFVTYSCVYCGIYLCLSFMALPLHSFNVFN